MRSIGEPPSGAWIAVSHSGWPTSSRKATRRPLSRPTSTPPCTGTGWLLPRSESDGTSLE
ncbi:MAG: hypothetical protein U5K43_14235 [Halofilum sp. (in: g-proteobacteria)]|nr:hypothetical protein [Halofilum sp. (in: g-proteobacteria)]